MRAPCRQRPSPAKVTAPHRQDSGSSLVVETGEQEARLSSCLKKPQQRRQRKQMMKTHKATCFPRQWTPGSDRPGPRERGKGQAEPRNCPAGLPERFQASLWDRGISGGAQLDPRVDESELRVWGHHEHSRDRVSETAECTGEAPGGPQRRPTIPGTCGVGGCPRLGRGPLGHTAGASACSPHGLGGWGGV